MTVNEVLNRLDECGAATATAAAPGLLDKLAELVTLPEEHLDLLRSANGVTAFGGYFRLFGFRTQSPTEMAAWNSDALWAFAWDKPLGDYWFFGETAWGDQYAYRRDELVHESTPKVYFLDALSMTPEVSADGFHGFLEDEFLRNARQPYDEMLVAARERLGDLALREHIAYVPSPLVTGSEDAASVSRIDAVASMVLNGDLYSQLGSEPQDRPIEKLEPYEDADGRTRLRVVWG